MPVSMLVRCEKCGYENFPQHRFCGMCAAELRLPGPGGSQPAPGPARVSVPPVSAPPVSSRAVSASPAPRPREQKEEAVAQKISGPSFLGLGNEPSDTRNLSYLLEDETPQHRGRNLVLIVLIAAVAVAAWYWRQDLRAMASRLLASPPPLTSTSGNNAPDANSGPSAATQAPAPVSSASAENKVPQTAPVAPSNDQTPAAQVPPAPAASGAADGTQTSPASPSQPGQSPAGQSTTDQSPAGQPSANQSSASQSEPSSPSPASNSATSAAAAKPGDSAGTAASQAAPGRRSAKLQSQPTAEELEAEGEKYLYGNGVPENCTRARTSLLAAAQRSSAQAQNVLGTMYATGHCATRDLPTAYRWFSRSLRKDPSNTRIEDDLKVLWNQMTPQERQVALRDAQ